MHLTHEAWAERATASVDGVTQPARTGPQPGAAKALLVYNALRLVLLAACLGLGYLAGLRNFLLIVAALVVSGALSWFLLAPQRIRAALAVERAVESPAGTKVTSPIRRRRAALRARVAAEDAYAEEFQRRQAEALAGERRTEPDAAR